MTYNIPGQTIPSDPSIASGDAALQAEIDALTARVAKLEGGPVVPPNTTGGIYGPAIAADTLNNLQVGGTNGPANRKVAFRFRATVTAKLSTITVYLVGGSGYAGGTGGQIKTTLQADSSGVPSGTPLATMSTINPGTGPGSLPILTFASPGSVTAGSLYYIVFENIDPSPRVNFYSVDLIYVFGSAVPQPRLGPDWAALYFDTAWTQYVNMTPILDLDFSDGSHYGNGYMEVWIASSPKPVSGKAQVREQFTPKADVTFSTIGFRCLRVSGTSPLTVSVGGVSATVPAANIPIGTPGVDHGGDGRWQVVTVPTTTITAGTSSAITWSSPADTTYSFYPVRKGVSYKFNPATYFADGNAQFSPDGTSWSNFPDEDGSPSTEGDLQFYLK